MQRDWDLIREILVAASGKAPGDKMLHTEISGFFPMQVGEHIADLSDAGYLRARVVKAYGYVMWAEVTGITTEGIDLLESLECGLARTKSLGEALRFTGN